jgi:hypothetical protein
MPESRTPSAALDTALQQLRQRVRVPEPPDYAARVHQRLAAHPPATRKPARPPYLRPLVAVAVALLVVGAVTLSGPGREAVARLFGLQGVRVVPISPSLPTPRPTIEPPADFGGRVGLAHARRLLSFDIALPSGPGLGRPAKVYVRTGPGLESVTLTFGPGPGLPEIRDSGIGLVLSEYAGSSSPYFQKYFDERRPPVAVTVAGTWPGLRFPGPHEVMVEDPSGDVRSLPPRVSAPCLVWEHGGVTYRLEARVGVHRALNIAGSTR